MISEGLDLATVGADTFSPLIDSDFGIRGSEEGEDAGSLRLTSVAGSSTPPSEKRIPFSLFFTGAASFVLGQGTYFFNHPSLGTFPLFIVPIAGDADTRQYQAVFS